MPSLKRTYVAHLVMSRSLLALFLAFLAVEHSNARIHSLPEDPHAFPKFKVSFLNNLPVLNETAQKWLSQGIPGGELEFLNQRWEQHSEPTPKSLKEIDDGVSGHSGSSSPVSSENNSPYSLEHMKMGPRDSYLCLIPRPLDLSPPSEDNLDPDVTRAHSWSLLQPLSTSCLYHRQGWFTYSYCHNNQIRQFRELSQPQSHTPEEDHSEDSYTLGKAPTSPETGADLTVAERNANNLQLARGAGSLYLVQHYGDGTICDKTGKSREVEVQFHCSMAMPDTILFVKEVKTCSYVLVINTPRLCGEPGFRSHRDVVEQAQIRCREIVDSEPQEYQDLPEMDYPQKFPRIKKTLPPKVLGEKKGEKGEKKSAGGESYEAMLRETLAAFLGGKHNLNPQVILQKVTDDGEFVIEFLDDDSDDGETLDEKITNVLRDAGFHVKGEDEDAEAAGGNGEQQIERQKEALGEAQVRDEL